MQKISRCAVTAEPTEHHVLCPPCYTHIRLEELWQQGVLGPGGLGADWASARSQGLVRGSIADAGGGCEGFGGESCCKVASAKYKREPTWAALLAELR